MRRYIAQIEEDLWIDFSAEQYRELGCVTMVKNDEEIACKIIPLGKGGKPNYWICFPVKNFQIVKEGNNVKNSK